METEGESNNYGMVDLNINSWVHMSVRGLFFDGVMVDSLYLFRFDIFNINLSSHVEICLLVDYSLIN